MNWQVAIYEDLLEAANQRTPVPQFGGKSWSG
jgi:hypothetical protein